MPALAPAQGPLFVDWITGQPTALPVISAKDYGVLADGVTDDTKAFTTALNAASANTFVLDLPSGNILITSPIVLTGSNYSVRGKGRQATTITCNFLTGDVISIGDGTANPANIRWEDLSFSATSSRSSGATFRIRNGYNVHLIRVAFEANNYVCLQLDGGSNQYQYFVDDMFTFGAPLQGIIVGNAGGLCQGVYIRGGVIANCVDVGIGFINASGCTVQNTELLTCHKGMYCFPGVGQACKSIWLKGCFIDSSTVEGLQLLPNGGIIEDSNFETVWCASNGTAGGNTGMKIGGGVGSVKGLSITAPRVVNNGGHGIEILSGCTDIDIVNPQVFGNSQTTNNTYDGINVAAGVSQWSVVGGASGLGGTITPNPQRYGINVLAGASDKYRIIGVDLTGNQTQGLNDAGTGLAKKITGNVGVDPAQSWSFSGNTDAAITITNNSTYDIAVGSGLFAFIDSGGVASGLVFMLVGAVSIVFDVNTKLSNVKDTANKLNIYFTGSVYELQNKTGSTLTLFIMPLGIRAAV